MSTFLDDIRHIYEAAKRSEDGQRCCVAPAPEIQERIRHDLKRLRESAGALAAAGIGFRGKQRVGFNDGLIVPGTELPLGAPPSVARTVALRRATTSKKKTMNVIVVLVEFSDKPLEAGRKQYFDDLFFSTGKIATGSVKEYFADVTGKKITIAGQVAGPYPLPMTLAQYAGGGSGIDNPLPNARTMARDAAMLADPDVGFATYDNDGDGFVDAYVIVHAGRGAEETGNPNDIWSHKWVLSGGALNVDGSKVFSYLTIPEDAKLGVSAHELGHLLFGFPDLYDIDGDSEGVGNWCLMGGGSWNNGGLTPAHPSAWCKAMHNWATVKNVTGNGTKTIKDVQTSRTVWRLWNNGSTSQEYFLAEFRSQTGYDKHLPGAGLLVWHVDDSIDDNSNQNHPKVALLQADGLKQLESATNRGDAGDPFPGSMQNTNLTAISNPNSLSYGGLDTNVAVTSMVPVQGGIRAAIKVKAAPPSGAAARKPAARKPAAKKKSAGGKKAPAKTKVAAKKKIAGTKKTARARSGRAKA
jgi:immune inhibitor A